MDNADWLADTWSKENREHASINQPGTRVREELKSVAEVN